MTSIAILGATGSLGNHVARQAAAARYSLSLLVRSPGRLSPEVAAQAKVVTADLITAPLATLAQFAEGHDVLVCSACLVTEGEKFVALVDRVVSAVGAVPSQRRPLCWLLCPGPMVEQLAIGVERLRISTDCIPAKLPAFAKHLPALLLLPLFAARVPEMISPYADAASVILTNATRSGLVSRKRVGLALPVGMRGMKDQWSGQPKNAA